MTTLRPLVDLRHYAIQVAGNTRCPSCNQHPYLLAPRTDPRLPFYYLCPCGDFRQSGCPTPIASREAAPKPLEMDPTLGEALEGMASDLRGYIRQLEVQLGAVERAQLSIGTDMEGSALDSLQHTVEHAERGE